MAEQVRQVELYSASIPNQVGKGARVLCGPFAGAFLRSLAQRQ